MADLDQEQQDYYLNRFGVRYLSVQDTPAMPPRRMRRRGRNRDHADGLLRDEFIRRQQARHVRGVCEHGPEKAADVPVIEEEEEPCRTGWLRRLAETLLRTTRGWKHASPT